MKWIKRMFEVREVREALLFILLVLTIFRIAAHIPIPGIDASNVANLLAANQFLGLLNVFSGGTLETLSIVALGVAPYITASIIVQLLGMIFPSVEEMQKEEQGRQKMNQWTRYATIPIALLQGYGILNLLGQNGAGGVLVGWNIVPALIAMTAGTVFLMWLGELISERKVGNGISIMILAGIIAGFPRFVQQTAATYTSTEVLDIVLFAVLLLVTIASVVVITEGQRNIPVQYARGLRGGAAQRIQSHIPMRLNTGGMIPIIFAVSMIVFPPLVAQFLLGARTEFLRNVATFVLQLFGNNLFYGILYFALVFAFTYFYSSVIFKPETIAENLQKQGGFIPGIRPGRETQSHLQRVQNRLLLTGATFLAVIAVLPIIVQEITGSQNLIVGGSSIIIVVGVIIDMMKQIDAQVSLQEYDVM